MADVNADQLLNLLGIDLDAAALALSGEAPLPEPGFVVKTKDDRGIKLFLNICSSLLVPPPSGWPPSGSEIPPEAAAYLTTGDLPADAKKRAEKLLSVPLHISDPKTEVDHSGEECTVMDCVANPNILLAATDFRPLKLFLVQLALNEAETRLKRQLDPQFKLPRMRCKGNLSPLMMRNPQIAIETDTLVLPGAAAAKATKTEKSGEKSLIIEEVAESGRAGEGDRIKNSKEVKYPSLQHSVRFEGRPVESVVITVQLPQDAEIKARLKGDLKQGIKVAVAGDLVSVTVPMCEILNVQLPLAVEGGSGGAQASLSRDDSSLVVRLPWRPFTDVQWENPKTS